MTTLTTPLVKQPGFPHRGWLHYGCDDRKKADNLCAYCGHHHVRYDHILGHPDYPHSIEVGCVCAGKLGLEHEAQDAERDTRRRASGLKRFIEKGWKTTNNGNPYKRVRVAVCGRGRFFKISINSKLGSKIFRDQKDAMTHAFNYIEDRNL
jgi:hypothetical protein